MDKAARWLKKILHYEFRDEALLEQALTHRSAAGANNERLEFLGDAVLDVVVSDAIYRHKPDADEGTLSRIRATLVKDTALAEIATELSLNQHIVLGSGERKAGGYRRESILADALEAIFGAVYLDAGFETASRVISDAYGARLAELPDGADLRDPKTRLQEYLQAQQLALPEYRVERVSGKAHRQIFDVSCTVAGRAGSTHGRGGSRRDAEQQAAQDMLVLLGEDG